MQGEFIQFGCSLSCCRTSARTPALLLHKRVQIRHISLFEMLSNASTAREDEASCWSSPLLSDIFSNNLSDYLNAKSTQAGRLCCRQWRGMLMYRHLSLERLPDDQSLSERLNFATSLSLAHFSKTATRAVLDSGFPGSSGRLTQLSLRDLRDSSMESLSSRLTALVKLRVVHIDHNDSLGTISLLQALSDVPTIGSFHATRSDLMGTEENVSALCTMVRKLPNLKSLHLEREFPPKLALWEALFDALASRKTVTDLLVSGRSEIPFKDPGFDAILPKLSRCISLEKLSIRPLFRWTCPPSFASCIRALTALQELELPQNFPSDGALYSAALSGHPSLRKIDCVLCPAAALLISLRALSALEDLTCSDFTPEVAEAFSSFLATSTTLKSVAFGVWGEMTNISAVVKVVESLSLATALQSLTIRPEITKISEAAVSIPFLLAQKSCSLSKLHVVGATFGPDWWLLLGSALASNFSLKELRCYGNETWPPNEFLSELGSNHTLRTLDLCINFEHCSSLAAFVTNNTILSHLSLRSCRMETWSLVVWDSLLDAVSTSSSIAKLTIRSANLSSSFCAPVCRMLAEEPAKLCILKFTMSYSQMVDKLMLEFARALSQNKNLLKIVLPHHEVTLNDRKTKPVEEKRPVSLQIEAVIREMSLFKDVVWDQ